MAADVVAVLACVLLPLAMVSSWVAGVVTNTDRYVATVGPLAADARIKKAVETELNRLALGAVSLPQQREAIASLLRSRGIGEQALDGAAPLADLLENVVEDSVARAVHQVVDSDEFVEAWETANRSAHTQLVAVLENDDAVLDADGRVSIQLATLVNAVVKVVGSSLPVPVRAVPATYLTASFPLMKASDLSKARHGYGILDAVGFWLPVVWLLGVGTALLLAPSRRRVLAFVGYGSVVALVLLAVALALARQLALDAAPVADRELLEIVWRQLFARLYDAARVGLLVAVALLAVRWVTGPGDRPVAVRTAARSSVAALRRTGPATLRAVAVLAAGVAVFWMLW